MMSVIFVFLDGVGLAPHSSRNPFSAAQTPVLHELLGGSFTDEQAQQRPGLLLRPIDATLGVPGTPQSGTGQTALLTGLNTAQAVGRHQPNYPPTALQAVLAQRSIFRRVAEQQMNPTFANAFSPQYWQALANRRVRRSASVIAAEGADLRLRTLEDLRNGQALMWDITGEVLQSRYDIHDTPLLSPEQAGAVLTALARQHHLVFFESFLTDLVGHGRLPISDTEAIERIDGLIGGLLKTRHPADTVLITSDHGNIEDRSTRGHTCNPVPLLVIGPAAPVFAAVADCAGVADAIMHALNQSEHGMIDYGAR